MSVLSPNRLVGRVSRDRSAAQRRGIPVYGVSGIAHDPDDVRAHGKDERIVVRSFDEGLEFVYQLARALARPARGARQDN